MASVTANLSGSPANNQVKKICPHFVKGNCTYGAKCKNLHVIPPQSSKTASNKCVNAKVEDPEIAALYAEVRNAELKQKLRARLAAALPPVSVSAPAPVIVSAPVSALADVPKEKVKGEEKVKVPIDMVLKTEAEFNDMMGKAVTELVAMIVQEPSSGLTQQLRTFNLLLSRTGYYTAKGLISIHQGVHYLSKKNNPPMYDKHYKDANPWKGKPFVIPPENADNSG